MELRIIGLGKMGANIARRLARDGHNVIAHNRTSEKAKALSEEESNIVAANSLNEMVDNLTSPRTVRVMVPAGEATEKTIEVLFEILSPGDTIIDGGNSNYKDTIRRAEKVKEKRVNYIDVGTSGGIWGLMRGTV